MRGPNWNNEINEEYERDKPPRIPPFYQYGSRVIYFDLSFIQVRRDLTILTTI